MKKFYFLLICFCLCNILAYNQNLITGEYFIDKDPGLGKGTSITFTSTDTIKSVTVPVSVSGLSVGYHYVYIRVKDSYGHWGNYRQQRFYVYNNDSIPTNEDSVYLVQAEYFIDMVPIPGKGKLIDLPHVSSISYDDSIPGFVADNLIHSVGVRVKDNKGAWSFIKADTVSVGGLDISIASPYYVKQNEKTKYSVTIKNNGSTDFHDLFLVVYPDSAENPQFAYSQDTINGVDVSSVNKLTNFNDANYIIVWLYSLPSGDEKTFDLYWYTSQGLPHQLLNHSFQIWANEPTNENSFLLNGDITLINNSKLFSLIRESTYNFSDSLSLKNITDSELLKKLTDWFANYNDLQNPQFINLLTKPIYKYLFDVELPDSSINLINQDCFETLHAKYYETDDNISVDFSNLTTTSNDPCPPPDCNTKKCDEIPKPSLEPIDMFYISDQLCQERCVCVCNNGDAEKKKQWHNAWDISMPVDKRGTGVDVEIVNGKEQSKYDNDHYPVKASYGGIATTGWQGGSDKKGWGWYVRITTCEGDNEFITTYAHLSEAGRKSGKVAAGDTIGYVSQTGATIEGKNNRHLHIEFEQNQKKVDPRCLFDAHQYYANKSDAPPPAKDCKVGPLCKDGKKIQCEKGKKTCSPPPSAQSCDDQEFIFPNDPNDKTGNKGYAIPQYITTDEQLHYGILFENKDSASASAQVVIIKDTLDKNRINVSSLRIESVTAGEMLIVLPDSVHIQNLDTIYTKQPINGTYVHVQTKFDTSSGILEFRMTSLDTLTLQPVTDPLAGFLPPDTTNFDGNGLVSFKVMPKSAIADGTVIYNTAHIIFDANPPIATGTWINTIDKASPSSYVNPLPEITYDTSFTVSWKGVDTGAGIIYYDIYYKKKNDTAYTKWLIATSDTSAMFTGQLDSTYQFYSIAYDSLLNIETAPDTADAFTTISSEVLPLKLLSFNANCTQNNVSLEWITTNESGIKNFNLEKSMNGTNWVSTEEFIQPMNTQIQSQYEFSDTYNGYNYYRLRISDVDGNFSYSPVLKISCGKIKNSLQAYPVPAKDLLNVLIQADKSENVKIVLTDMYGRVIKRMNANIQTGVNNLSFSTNDITSGQYILKVESSLNLNSQKIIIVR